MAGKPLLYFIHGMWAQPRIWDTLRAHFEQQGYKTKAPALPGHDVTPDDPVPDDLDDLGLRDYVAALEADLREIEGPVVLIGHSMGGLIAQMLASRIASAGLVLLATAPSAGILPLAWEPIRTAWPILSQWGFWDEDLPLPREAAFYGVFNNMPAAEAELEYANAIHESGKAFAEVAFGFFSGRSRVEYEHIRCPSLIVVGTEDRITPASFARATARRLPGPVQYREIDGAGHWLFHQPVRGKVAGFIERFLNDIRTH